MEQHIQFGKLFLHDPVRSRHESEIFIGNHRSSDSTKLIIIIDFPRARTDQAYLVDSIIKEVAQGFDQIDDTNPEVLLEEILKSLNVFLPEIAPKKNRDWLRDLGLLVAISDKGQIHFANIGNLQALLLQQKRLAIISEKNPHFNPLKLFGNISSGILNPDDVIIFTTGTLTDYISEIKIKQILKDLPPVEAVHRFEDLLEEVPSFVTFNAVILKFIREGSGLAFGLSKGQLRRQPRKDAIEPSEEIADIDVRPGQPRLKSRKGRLLKRRGSSIINIRGLRAAISIFIYYAVEYFKIIGRITTLIIKLILAGLKFIFSKKYREDKEKHVWNKIDGALNTATSSVKKTSKLNQILLTATAVVLIIFVNVIIFRGQSNQTSKTINAFNENIASIGQKQAEVDSAKIYKDNQKAEQILLEMEALLNSIAPLNQEQQTQLDDLRENIARQLNDARKISYIADPLVFKDLSQIAQPIYDMNIVGDKVEFAASDGIYEINGEPVKIVDNQLQPTLLIANRSQNLIFAMINNQLSLVKDNALISVELSTNGDFKNIDQALIYSDNLYLLDRQAGAIWKHNGYSNGAKFQNGTYWLDEPTVVSNSQSFAIDGNIYLITDQGEIIKLFKGEREAFNYQKPNPAFGANSSIYTNRDSDFLYILDPANKRVAIISKDGSIKDQFTSPKFDNLKSLVIDSAEKTIYILNGDKIYLLAINK